MRFFFPDREVLVKVFVSLIRVVVVSDEILRLRGHSNARKTALPV